jgi:hypothetical protein
MRFRNVAGKCASTGLLQALVPLLVKGMSLCLDENLTASEIEAFVLILLGSNSR